MPFLLITATEQKALHLSRSTALLKAMDEQGALPKEDGPPTGPQAQGQQQSPLEPQAHHEGNASLPSVPSPQHLQDQQLLAANQLLQDQLKEQQAQLKLMQDQFKEMQAKQTPVPKSEASAYDSYGDSDLYWNHYKNEQQK